MKERDPDQNRRSFVFGLQALSFRECLQILFLGLVLVPLVNGFVATNQQLPHSSPCVPVFQWVH
jgi:hypothetical protein